MRLPANPRDAAPGVAPLRLERERRPPHFEAQNTQRQMALVQLALYVVVGGICFCIDIGGFIVLRYLGVPILVASAASFTTATLANYLLCCALVFHRGRFSRAEEMLRLFSIAVVGLGLNSAAVWFLAKVFAVIFVFIWIRATLPRLRYDQLMALGWKVLVPVGLLNLAVTGALLVWHGGRG